VLGVPADLVHAPRADDEGTDPRDAGAHAVSGDLEADAQGGAGAGGGAMNPNDTYGIWFTDGELSCGWLQAEGGNGRLHRFESRKEHAEEQCRRETENDSAFAFRVLPLKGDEKEFERIVEEARQEARAKQRARWA